MSKQAPFTSEAGFPLGEFVRANGEKSNVIGWRQTLTTLPANHIRFLLVRQVENRLEIVGLILVVDA